MTARCYADAVLFLVQYPVVIGVALAVIFAALRWMLVPRDRFRAEWLLVAASLALPANAACELLTMWLSHVVPHKLDLYVYWLDGRLGIHDCAVGQFVVKHLWLEVLANMAYSVVPCGLILTLAMYLWFTEETRRVAYAFALNLVAIIPFYVAFPVCGPAFAFPQFPQAPLHVIPHAIAIAAPPNGMPSGHASMALLILWFLWRWPLLRIGAGVYCVLIVIATLGSGQHYALDLVMAVPYAWLVWRATVPSMETAAAVVAAA